MPYVSTEFGGWFDFAKDLIPSHTVVGKLLGGDTSGATKDAIALVTKPSAPVATATPMPYAEGTFAPCGFVERNQTVLILGAGALALYLVMGRRRGGGRR